MIVDDNSYDKEDIVPVSIRSRNSIRGNGSIVLESSAKILRRCTSEESLGITNGDDCLLNSASYLN
jgi:hypothetical protein